MEVAGKTTRVLTEQTAAVAPQRGGTLSFDELRAVDAALHTVLDLDL